MVHGNIIYRSMGNLAQVQHVQPTQRCLICFPKWVQGVTFLLCSAVTKSWVLQPPEVATIKIQAENLVDIDTVLGPMLAKMDNTGQVGAR